MSTVGSSPIGACLSLSRALSQAASPEDIYAAALDVLSQALGVSRASVLLFDSDGVMRFKAWRGLSDAYRTAVEGHSPWTPDTIDAQTIVVADVVKDRSFETYRAVFAAERIAALVFIPLVNAGRVIGTFMLYFETPHHVSDDEQQLAEVIAAEVAFALARIDAEERARLNEERLRFALRAAAMGTWELDLSTRIVSWSDSLQRIHGYDPGAFDQRFVLPDCLAIHQVAFGEKRRAVHDQIHLGNKPFRICFRNVFTYCQNLQTGIEFTEPARRTHE